MMNSNLSRVFLKAMLLTVGLFGAHEFLTGQVVDREDLVRSVSREVASTMEKGRIPSASIALVAGKEVVWAEGFGYSNLWARTRAKPETVYLIGSTFKTMSTYALLQQMEAGKFKLDDSVNNYMKEFKIRGEDHENPVTFRHLLTHTSGLPGGFVAFPVWGDTVPPPLNVSLKKMMKLRFRTGSRVLYSNPAFTLVAYLVEQFAGQPYKQVIRERIFEPIELDDTDFIPKGDMEERLSIPYFYDRRTGTHKPASRSKADVWPAGVVYGTILDQARWLIVNLNHGCYDGGRLLSEAVFDQLMTRQYERFSGPIHGDWLNETTGYGLTWWISEYKGDKLFAHSGSVNGYTAFIVGNLDKKIGFAVLTNGDKVHSHLFALALSVLELLDRYRPDPMN